MLSMPVEARALQVQNNNPAPLGARSDAPLSRFAMRVMNRLAMHVPASLVRLRHGRPMVSFTFDDVPHGAATVGAELLGEYGSHGTFYVAGGLVGSNDVLWNHATAPDLVALHRAGHELACHTFSHRRLPELSGAELISEADRNQAFFKTLDPSIDLQNFAYPWGCGDVRRKPSLSRRFRTSRSVHPGINHGVVDPQFLLSMPLEDALTDPAGIDRALDDALKVGGWLIFYSHDVVARAGEFACSPALLRYALEGARRRNFQIANVAEATVLAGI